MLYQMHIHRYYSSRHAEMIASPMTTWMQLWIWQNFPSWSRYLYA